MAFQPEEDLTCPVCQDIFKDPVVLTCSHSLCKDCVRSWWREKPTQECPLCKRRSSKSELPLNLALRNLCEAYQQQQKKDHVCPLHSETFKLFCLNDKQPVCVVCRDSDAHHKHKFKPISEASKPLKKMLQKSLNPLKERLELVEKFRENCELSLDHIKIQSEHTANLIEKEFLKLHDFLSQQQESRIKALKEEEKQKTHKMKDKMVALDREIEVLSETIRATEEQLRAADVSFLLKYKAAEERVQCCPLLEEPQLDTGALIDQAKHVGNLGFNIWSNMKGLVHYSPVILDPNTAHPELILSNHLTSFTFGDKQELPKNPERVRLDLTIVRGSEGFDSGSHSWDVDVTDGDHWELGVVTKSAYSIKEDDEYIDEDAGWWSLQFSDGQYRAFSIDRKKENVLKFKSRSSRVRLHLECDRRRLTFYDTDTNARIHCFTHLYQQKVFPVFRGQQHPLIAIVSQNI